MSDAMEIISRGLFQTAVNMMDNDIREGLCLALAPCTEIEFLAVYMAIHEDTFHEVFTI